MNTKYLEELIVETRKRDGGFILNFNEKPAVVVLTIDKYNEMIANNFQDTGTINKTLVDEAETSHEMKKILVTGGAGYIGSHAVRELLKAGFEVTVLDNLSAGKRSNVPGGAFFIEGDIGDVELLRKIFSENRYYAVMHFAAYLEVEESVAFPEKYLKNNVLNTGLLLSAMNEHGVKNIIFSSTAAVYGDQIEMPINEQAKPHPNNPYGHSKLLAERLIKFYSTYSGFKSVVFRYFNACGCDFDGTIVATHQTHLIPIILGVALGKKPFLQVNGDDYNTPDGTCVRDYVHVLDIAKAHVVALQSMEAGDNFRIYNIGTGRGSTVKEVATKTSEVLGKIIPMEIGERRAGDAEQTVADNQKIKKELGFELKHSDLETIIMTSWNQILKLETHST